MRSNGENTSQDSSVNSNENKRPPFTMQSPPSQLFPASPSPPFINKFVQNLRRDLLLSNFDRNLTVEQAHFDSNLSLGVSQDNLAASGIHGGEACALSNHTVNFNSDSNIDLNNDSNNYNNNYSNKLYPPHPDVMSVCAHSPLVGPMLTPPAEPHHLSRRTSNSKLDTKRKQPKRSPIHSTASPSEYFHRNLVNAVSNVEDSDENENFVYPYSDHHHHNNNKSISNNYNNHNIVDYYNPSSPRPLLASQKSYTGTLRSSLSSHELSDTTTTTAAAAKPHRPKLRSYVLDPHSAKKDYGSTKGSQARFADSQLLPWSNRYSPSSQVYPPYYQQVSDRYASDDYGESSLWKYGYRKCSHYRWFTKRTICGLITFLVLLCFTFLLYGAAQSLQDVTIGIGNVLASDKELIFDLNVTAYNPNGWTVHIADVEINVFALSETAPLQSTLELESSLSFESALYLGSVYRFDEPLAFSSSVFSTEPSEAVSQIRIKPMGHDDGGNETWSGMIRSTYDLLARGVLFYHPLGLLGVYSTQSVTICNVVKINPFTGVVSRHPDQDLCSMTNQ